jgi:hypothetical protein
LTLQPDQLGVGDDDAPHAGAEIHDDGGLALGGDDSTQPEPVMGDAVVN